MIFGLMRSIRVLVAVSGIWLLLFLATTYAEDRDCSVPERFSTFEPPLTKTVKALAGGREVIIATLGGASTLGVAAGGGGLAWPTRLASVLAEKFPVRAHQGGQSRCGAPDGEAGGRASG